MPKPLLVEARDDFSGGRNTAFSPERLNANELLNATNARISAEFGGIVKRTGSRRMHPTGLPAAIMGIVQWDSPSGKQIVAISNGDLYHKTTEFGDFTLVDPGPTDAFSTTLPALFAPFRDSTANAALILYIASGGKLYKWTGSSLVRLDGTLNAPQADLIIPYHTRTFARDQRFLKSINWGVLGAGADYTLGVGTGAGIAFVDVLNGEKIVALEVVGSSLVMGAEDSLMRYTGYSSDDIQISQDTEGISAEIGVVGPLALKRVENVAFGAAERGPHAISEITATPVGIKIETDWDALDRVNLSKIVVQGHRGRREVWFAVPGPSDSGLNKTIYCYSTRLQAWVGPWTYSFGVSCLTRYEDANGDEWVIAGCSDGFVRHMDTGALDDVTSAGTGGSNISLVVELAPIFFAAGPGAVKSLKRFYLQGDFPAASAPILEYAFDGASLTQLPLAGYSAGVKSYRLDPASAVGQGKRLRVRFTDVSADIPIFLGLLAEAWAYSRTY